MSPKPRSTPHVTFFFNGGREAPFPGEDRLLVPSPKEVATYDLKPEMSAYGIRDGLLQAIADDAYDFILVNFANADMVGHTGVIPAVITAVETVDACLGAIIPALLAKGGAALITADHGNAELLIDPAVRRAAHGAHNQPGAMHPGGCAGGRAGWRDPARWRAAFGCCADAAGNAAYLAGTADDRQELDRSRVAIGEGLIGRGRTQTNADINYLSAFVCVCPRPIFVLWHRSESMVYFSAVQGHIWE